MSTYVTVRPCDRYVTSTLELLVVDDYMIVYFHSSTPRSQMPGPLWIKKCYDLIDRRCVYERVEEPVLGLFGCGYVAITAIVHTNCAAV